MMIVSVRLSAMSEPRRRHLFGGRVPERPRPLPPRTCSHRNSRRRQPRLAVDVTGGEAGGLRRRSATSVRRRRPVASTRTLPETISGDVVEGDDTTFLVHAR